jgi:hypothetical protein
MKVPAPGPGLAKTARAPLLTHRTVRLVLSSDARWKQAFETADVVSEGAPRGERAERQYFGSSDIVLFVGPERAHDTIEMLAAAIALDPHVRLRALRLARREAAQRAQGPLGCVRAEISVSACARGVSVHVELEARVFADRRAAPRPLLAAADGGVDRGGAGLPMGVPRDELDDV